MGNHSLKRCRIGRWRILGYDWWLHVFKELEKWNLLSGGSFQVKSYYHSIRGGTVSSFPWKPFGGSQRQPVFQFLCGAQLKIRALLLIILFVTGRFCLVGDTFVHSLPCSLGVVASVLSWSGMSWAFPATVVELLLLLWLSFCRVGMGGRPVDGGGRFGH